MRKNPKIVDSSPARYNCDLRQEKVKTGFLS